MDILVLIAIIVAISRLFGKKNQQDKRVAAQKKSQGMDDYYAERFSDRMASAKSATAASGTTAARTIPFPAPQATPMQPTVAASVHTHTAPACDEHDQSGSMSFTSTEGIDACHEEQMTPLRPERSTLAETEEKPGLELEWNGESMVKAFVMQEILTRPCDRRRKA